MKSPKFCKLGSKSGSQNNFRLVIHLEKMIVQWLEKAYCMGLAPSQIASIPCSGIINPVKRDRNPTLTICTFQTLALALPSNLYLPLTFLDFDSGLTRLLLL